MSTPAHAPARPGAFEGGFARAETFIAEHRNAVLAAAAAGVAGFALLMRRRSSAASTDGVQQGYQPSSYTTAGGGYDSTANDVYDSLQPGLEDLQHQIDALVQGGGTTVTPATPAPRPPAPAKLRYTTVAGDTLHSVAVRFHVTDTQLLVMNPTSPARTPSSRFPVGTSVRVQL
jgi:LysM repeat protein